MYCILFPCDMDILFSILHYYYGAQHSIVKIQYLIYLESPSQSICTKVRKAPQLLSTAIDIVVFRVDGLN